MRESAADALNRAGKPALDRQTRNADAASVAFGGLGEGQVQCVGLEFIDLCEAVGHLHAICVLMTEPAFGEPTPLPFTTTVIDFTE